MPRLSWRAAVSVVATTLLSATPAIASAQSSTNELLQELIASSSYNTGSSGAAIGAALSSTNLPGSSNLV